MSAPAPLIDTRNASDVAAQVRTLLQAYAPEYQADAPGTFAPLGGALIGIFARFSELIIQRLNRVPEKNFFAYLDLLGASQLPPQPARVALTFSLASGTIVAAVVPAGTQAAAPPGPGEKEPIIFETERELVATPATLTAAFVRDPELDIHAELGDVLSGASSHGVPVFRGDRQIDHIVYFGFGQLLGLPNVTSFQLTVNLSSLKTDPRDTEWEAWDGSAWTTLPFGPGGDGTSGLRVSGTINFGAVSTVPVSTVQGIESRWVRARLRTLINRSTAVRNRMVRASQLPAVTSVTAQATVAKTGVSPEAAFVNASQLDTSKDFFPFSETPGFGDTFFLRVDEPLAVGGAVSLHIDITNPTLARVVGGLAPAPTTLVATQASSDLVLSWEVWNGTTWAVLGTSTPTQASGLVDGTKAFTQSGDVVIGAVGTMAPRAVNGVEGYWLRVRISAGNYGREARYLPVADGGFKLEPASYAPPIVQRIAVAYTATKASTPDAIVTYNDFASTQVAKLTGSTSGFVPFAPFTPTVDDQPTLYLGLELPPAVAAFPNRPVSLFVRAAAISYGERPAPIWPTRVTGAGVPGSTVTHRFTITNPEASTVDIDFTSIGTSWTPAPVVTSGLTLGPGQSAEASVNVMVPQGQAPGTSDAGRFIVMFSTLPDRAFVASFVTWSGSAPLEGEPVRLAWEASNPAGWAPLTVRDATNSLAQSGTIEFLAPPSFEARPDFSVGPRYWLRVRWEKGDTVDPRLVRLLLNTTMAGQTVSVRNETLGSSDGSKTLRFKATRAPILPGQSLRVREPELPSTSERAAIEGEEGSDAITVALDASSRPKEIWVRWHAVSDFYASGPRDRHYVVDRLTGEIRFGDGLNGLVPPIGAGNVRLTSYQTGGGSNGNRPAGTIVQLKTTVPYVDKVINHDPAAGGADAEPLESLFDRVPREVRHGGRAVTVEDYEDLARLASPEVARALCVPLANLAETPLVETPSTPGQVSVVIVPRSADASPLPSLELIRRVRESLDAVHVPTATLSVVGPLYVRVDVTAQVAVSSLEGASTVLADVQAAVASFLHPLTGGLDGTGWDFGRRPHESDLHALIEAVPGVDHIRALDVVEIEDVPGVTLTGRFLVYAGTPNISVVFEEA
jgi:hypothetical protein